MFQRVEYTVEGRRKCWLPQNVLVFFQFNSQLFSSVININSLVACRWSRGDIGGRQVVNWLFCTIFTENLNMFKNPNH